MKKVSNLCCCTVFFFLFRFFFLLIISFLAFWIHNERERASERREEKKTRRRQKRSLMKLPIIDQPAKQRAQNACALSILYVIFHVVLCEIFFLFLFSDCLSLFFLCKMRTIECARYIVANVLMLRDRRAHQDINTVPRFLKQADIPSPTVVVFKKMWNGLAHAELTDAPEYLAEYTTTMQ